MTTFRQLCTFYLDDLYLGVSVQEVQEVLTYRAMTRVPRALGGVRGLINLRGQIVPAIDLRHTLGRPPRPAEQQPLNVVIRTEDGAVSLLVDAIGDVLEVADDAFERPPETLTSDFRRLIPGTFKLEDRLLLLLDTEQVVQRVIEQAAGAA